jgi:ATP-dependent Zn protease
MRNYEKAKVILTKHRAILDNLANALLEKEVLDSNEISAIVGQPA